MTNDERRVALNSARRRAYEHALRAESIPAEHDAMSFTRHARLAEVWANVAQAMKDGDPDHDAPGPDGASAFAHPTLTR